MSLRQRDGRPGRWIGADIHGVFAEVKDRQRAHEKEEQDGDGEQRYDNGDGKRQLDTTRVQPDKDDITENPPDRLEAGRRLKNRGEIGSDEVDDYRRRQHIFDVLGNSGDEAAPRAKRRPGERIGAAGMRQGRAHLGDRIGETEIHDGDEDGGDKHAAPAADVEPEVPAREIAGDNRADAKSPKREDPGMAPQLTLLEIVLAGDMIRNPAFMSLLSHFPTPSVISPF